MKYLSPWAREGSSVARSVTSAEEAIKGTSLDFTVAKRRLYDADMNAVDGVYQTVRTDKLGADAHLGVVGSTYEVIQNSHAFNIVDGVLGAGLEVETAGTFKGGRQVYLQCRFTDQSLAVRMERRHSSTKSAIVLARKGALTISATSL